MSCKNNNNNSIQINNSQLHGKIFEELIKNKLGIKEEIKMNEQFDIPKEIIEKVKGENVSNKILNEIPTVSFSIKTKKRSKTQNERFDLADAKRIFSIEEDFKLIVGLFEQKKDKKIISEVLEYSVGKEELQKLKGTLTKDKIEKFEKEIKAIEDYKVAREYAKKEKSKIVNENKTIIQLNHKIDSKKQRREQCSIKRKEMESILLSANKSGNGKNDNVVKIHCENFYGIKLPIIIESAQRIINHQES